MPGLVEIEDCQGRSPQTLRSSVLPDHLPPFHQLLRVLALPLLIKHDLNAVLTLSSTFRTFPKKRGHSKMVFTIFAMVPLQIYCFYPSTGQARVVADQFVHPNGITFTHDSKCAFVLPRNESDSFIYGILRQNASDSGIPDGIQFDAGNIYSGCGEGTHIWNTEGTLIRKLYLHSTSAQMIFTKSGLVILNEEVIHLANVQAQELESCHIQVIDSLRNRPNMIHT
ncbi:uncharacterized protein F5147DRAFT_760808 [Suillus discolor]|uniref:Uncharacterized protein n=1 Tax=Suillus discolor TaxID=1912936 RepID=A0A9P7F6Z7_9AGAM|nr:uncharacterized protein F5147DRAFT_760808 [Suillus discolor]KAG2108952.1 hypothetical protein F5147DRAFT_760808 [Suillus discolor]